MDVSYSDIYTITTSIICLTQEMQPCLFVCSGGNCTWGSPKRHLQRADVELDSATVEIKL